jgi:hypothetical protein
MDLAMQGKKAIVTGASATRSKIIPMAADLTKAADAKKSRSSITRRA